MAYIYSDTCQLNCALIFGKVLYSVCGYTYVFPVRRHERTQKHEKSEIDVILEEMLGKENFHGV